MQTHDFERVFDFQKNDTSNHLPQILIVKNSHMKKHSGYEPEKFDYTFKKNRASLRFPRLKLKRMSRWSRLGSTHQKLSLFTLNVRTCPPLKNTYFLSKNKIEKNQNLIRSIKEQIRMTIWPREMKLPRRTQKNYRIPKNIADTHLKQKKQSEMEKIKMTSISWPMIRSFMTLGWSIRFLQK